MALLGCREVVKNSDAMRCDTIDVVSVTLHCYDGASIVHDRCDRVRWRLDWLGWVGLGRLYISDGSIKT